MPGFPNAQNKKSTLDFLGTIGTKKGSDSVSLNNTAKALIELGEFLITKARGNLDRKGNIATGKTSASMNISNLQAKAAKLELDIEVLSTYKFLDQGVKGVESGRGKYQFKTKRVSKRHALAMLYWIKRRRIVTKYKQISKTEGKNKAIKAISDQAASQKSLAYAIAAGIKKHGIDPTYFFSDAVKATRTLQKQKYSKALKLDIIESLNDLNSN